jgi:hypothetical protein
MAGRSVQRKKLWKEISNVTVLRGVSDEMDRPGQAVVSVATIPLRRIQVRTRTHRMWVEVDGCD